MKKYVLITVILCLIALFSAINIASANLTVTDAQTAQAVNSLITYKSSEFLSVLDSTDEIKSISVENDELNNTDFYKVETNNYLLKLDTDDKNVTGIYAKTSDTNFTKESTESEAREFINAKYEQLNLPEDYDLVYLEKIDEYTWEADFQRKYGDVYNMYEAVKVFFTPENNEIIALTVFDEPYENNKETKITTKEAKEIVSNELNIDSKIISEELTIIKSNNYFENSNDKDLHKAWVLTTKDNESIYVDAINGDVIGGDCINE